MSLPQPRQRFKQRCIFCGTENRKRSEHAIFFRCKNPECRKVNPGPGMSAAHAQALTLALQPVTNGKKKRSVEPPAVLTLPAPAAPATVIRAAKSVPPSSSPVKPAAKPAPTAKPPAEPEPAGKKRSWIYG